VRSAPLQRGVAEFVGTFTLIFVGAGSIIATHGANLTAIALAHGLAIGVMASAVGHISGGHFNPAVTLGFLVTRRIEPRLAATYWFTQITAGVLAAFLLSAVLPQPAVDAVDLGVPALGTGISPAAGLVIEIVLTFFLVWVIFACAADARHLHRRPLHRRRDEPCAGARPAARAEHLERRLGVVPRACGWRGRGRVAVRLPLPAAAFA
jgi:glycerol uptake facilitator-like aquaporin